MVMKILPQLFAAIVLILIGYSIGRYIHKEEPVKIESSNVKYKEFWKDSNSWATKPITIKLFDTITDTVETKSVKIDIPLEILKNDSPTRVWSDNVTRDKDKLNIGLWNTSTLQYEVFEYDLSNKFYFSSDISVGYPINVEYNLNYNINDSFAINTGLSAYDKFNDIYYTVGIKYTF